MPEKTEVSPELESVKTQPVPILNRIALQKTDKRAVVPLTIKVARQPTKANAWLDQTGGFAYQTAQQAENAIWVRSDEYRSLTRARAEASRLSKVHTETDYEGWVFDPLEGGAQDGYFREPSELLEWYEDEAQEPPSFAFCCTETPFAFDLEGALYNTCEEHHADAFDSLSDVLEITAAFKAWMEKQTLVSYFPDYKRAVVIDQGRFEAERAEASAFLAKDFQSPHGERT